jgi:type II secretory pathway pseudopilin PulG
MKLQPVFRPSRRTGIRAFTIIEALVSACVVGVLFISLYSGITAGFGALNSARENLRATQVMIDKMETLRLYSWSQVSTFGSSTSYIPTTFTESFFPATTNYSRSLVSTGSAGAGFVYYGTVEITNSGFSQNYSNSVKVVTVTLRWTNGVARSQTMSTYTSQYGIQNYIY